MEGGEERLSQSTMPPTLSWPLRVYVSTSWGSGASMGLGWHLSLPPCRSRKEYRTLFLIRRLLLPGPHPHMKRASLGLIHETQLGGRPGSRPVGVIFSPELRHSWLYYSPHFKAAVASPLPNHPQPKAQSGGGLARAHACPTPPGQHSRGTEARRWMGPWAPLTACT